MVPESNLYASHMFTIPHFEIPIHLRTLKILTILLLSGMLAACLFPYGVRAVNKVVPRENPERFAIENPGIICSGIFDGPDGRTPCTIDLVVATGGKKTNSMQSVVVFCDSAWKERFILAKWRSWLILQKMGNDGKVAGELEVENGLKPGVRTAVSLVQTDGEIRIFTAGKLREKTTRFLLFDTIGSDKWRICIGCSPVGKRYWEGELFSFKFEYGSHSVRFPPVKDFPEDRSVRFTVPERMPYLRTPFLTLPDDHWTDFSNLSDFLLNMIGFIPWGFMTAMLLRVEGVKPAVAIGLVTVLSGFLMSLGIEWTQTFIYGRYSEWSDLILNTVGSCAGAALALRKNPSVLLGVAFPVIRQNRKLQLPSMPGIDNSGTGIYSIIRKYFKEPGTRNRRARKNLP
jgi:VanZ family protein